MTKATLQITSAHDVSPEDVQAALEGLLSSQVLCSLATVNADSSPHINTCYFAERSTCRIFVLTPPSTRHSANLLSGGRFAFNLFRNDQVFGDKIVGAQLFGTARQLSILASLDAFTTYTRKFRIFSEWFPELSMVGAKLESRFFELSVSCGKLIDESRFGNEVYVEFLIAHE